MHPSTAATTVPSDDEVLSALDAWGSVGTDDAGASVGVELLGVMVVGPELGGT